MILIDIRDYFIGRRDPPHHLIIFTMATKTINKYTIKKSANTIREEFDNHRKLELLKKLSVCILNFRFFVLDIDTIKKIKRGNKKNKGKEKFIFSLAARVAT
jgi:hypothetical protein